MRKLLCLLFLLAFFSSAFAVSVQVLPLNSSARPGGVLSYKFTFSEEGLRSRTVLMYMITTLSYSFSPSSQITVMPGETSDVYLYLMLPPSVNEGRYFETVFLDIDGAAQSMQTISYTVEEPQKYFSLKSINVPLSVDPRVPFNIFLNIENSYSQISRVYSGIEIYRDDGTSLFFNERVLDTPLGNVTIPIEVRLSPDVLPGVVNARVNLTWYDLELGSKVEQFSISGYSGSASSPVAGNSVTSSSKGIIIRNNGTITMAGFDYEVPINSIDAYFIVGASTPYSISGNILVFHVPDLLPGESVELVYTTNYLVLYLLPFVFFGLIYVVYSLSRVVSVSKSIFELKTKINIVTFKVVLKVSNISKKRVSKLRIIEPLAPIISEVFEYGTLHGELKSVKGRQIIVWNIGELRPSEEIVLSYRAKSKVGLIGGLELGRGVAEVLDSNGRVINRSFTNNIIIESSKKE